MGTNGEKPKPVAVVEWSTIRIAWCPTTNELQVNGPLDNSILFLGMLEMAKISLLEYRAKRAVQNIVEAPPGLRL